MTAGPLTLGTSAADVELHMSRILFVLRSLTEWSCRTDSDLQDNDSVKGPIVVLEALPYLVIFTGACYAAVEGCAHASPTQASTALRINIFETLASIHFKIYVMV